MEERETSNDGREECGKGVGSNGLSYHWHRRASHEGTALDLEVEDDVLVEEHTCLRNASGPPVCTVKKERDWATQNLS